MATYKMYKDGKEITSMWINGKEIVEAWTLVNGEKKQIWGKGSGGGFYDADGNLLMDWNTTYVMTVDGEEIQFNIPHYKNISYPLTVVSAFPNCTIYMQQSDNPPIDQTQIAKIVVPSEVTAWSGSGILGNYFSDQNSVKEIIFNSGEQLAFTGDSPIIYQFPSLEKVVCNRDINIDNFGLGYIINQNGYSSTTVECEADFSKCTWTKLPNYAFINCNMKSLVLPDTLTSLGSYIFTGCTIKSLEMPWESITSYGENAFNYFNQYDDYDIDFYFPNVHDYPRVGWYTRFRTVTIPSNSTVEQGFFAMSPSIAKHFVFNDNIVFKADSVYLGTDLETEDIIFNGTNFDFSEASSSVFRGYFNGKIIFDDDITEFNTTTTKNSIFNFYFCYENFELHLPTSLTAIPQYMFNGTKSSENTMTITIPSGVKYIGKYGLRTSGFNLNFENPNGWYYLDDSSERHDLTGLDDPSFAASMMGLYYIYDWYRE